MWQNFCLQGDKFADILLFPNAKTSFFQMASFGINVVLISRSEEKLSKVAEEISKLGF